MITIKLYVPLHDNDGQRMLHIHDWLIDRLTINQDVNFKVAGFTTYDAKGYWMDNGQRFTDEQRIYEFHIDEHRKISGSYCIKMIAQNLCKSLRQECIYMTIDNEQHFITEDK